LYCLPIRGWRYRRSNYQQPEGVDPCAARLAESFPNPKPSSYLHHDLSMEKLSKSSALVTAYGP